MTEPHVHTHLQGAWCQDCSLCLPLILSKDLQLMVCTLRVPYEGFTPCLRASTKPLLFPPFKLLLPGSLRFSSAFCFLLLISGVGAVHVVGGVHTAQVVREEPMWWGQGCLCWPYGWQGPTCVTPGHLALCPHHFSPCSLPAPTTSAPLPPCPTISASSSNSPVSASSLSPPHPCPSLSDVAQALLPGRA